MIVPHTIAHNYEFLRPYFDKVKEIIDQTLINYCSQNHFAYSSRVKGLDSLAEKIESGRYADWDSLDDFIGSVIIVPSIKYEPQILKFLESSFVKVELKKRGSSLKSSDVFRFDATRFIGKLSSVNNEEIIHTINFEIQIRTAFEHAWSVTTHDLSYKSKTVDWKILRLAAQLKSSVEQLDMIILGAYEIKNSIQEHKWPETEVKLKICLHFDRLFEENLIPKELEPKDMSRFSENIYYLMKNTFAGLESKKWIPKTNSILLSIENHLKTYTTTNFPMSLSLYQICFGILIKKGVISEEFTKKHPFSKSDIFEFEFPESKNMKIKEFKVKQSE